MYVLFPHNFGPTIGKESKKITNLYATSIATLSLLLRWPMNLFRIGLTMPVVDRPSGCLLWCKHNPLTFPSSQGIPEGAEFIVAKVTRVTDTTRYWPTNKGHLEGRDDFVFILRIIDPNAGAANALLSEDSD
jgi:hypothetical protein